MGRRPGHPLGLYMEVGIQSKSFLFEDYYGWREWAGTHNLINGNTCFSQHPRRCMDMGNFSK